MLARALLSARAACSSASTVAARSFSEAAAAAAAPASQAAAEGKGSKSVIFRILKGAQEPLTSAQVWEAAQGAGLPSKRYTKRMLQQLKNGGWVKTQPVAQLGSKKQRNYGYRLNQYQQQQRQVKLERRAGGSSNVPAAAAAATEAAA